MTEREKALDALGREYADRSEQIIREWRKEHPLKGRGEGDIVRKKALDKEMALRYKEILEKYPQK